MKKRTLLLSGIGVVLIVMATVFLLRTWPELQDHEEPAGGNSEAAGTAGEIYVSYPEYTEEAVADGHFTSGFDLRMVLLGFRDKLDRGDYDVQISLDKETDFVLWQDRESGDIHAVMKGADGKQYAIATVGDAGIDRFPTFRQVHSFRIVSAEDLDACTQGWETYGSSSGPQGEGSVDSGSVIKAETGEILLYNAADKEHVISLEGEDRDSVEALLDGVSLTEEVKAQEPLQYVIKVSDCKYMFDWTGAGIKDVHDDGTTLMGFELSQEELELLEELCKKHGIYE